MLLKSSFGRLQWCAYASGKLSMQVLGHAQKKCDLNCRERQQRVLLEAQLSAAVAKAASDGARWREEVELKQARIDLLVAGDVAKEAEFMARRVRELQVR